MQFLHPANDRREMTDDDKRPWFGFSRLSLRFGGDSDFQSPPYHKAADQGAAIRCNKQASRKQGAAAGKGQNSNCALARGGCGPGIGVSCMCAGSWDAAGNRVMQLRELHDSSSSVCWCTSKAQVQVDVESPSSKNRPRSWILALKTQNYSTVQYRYLRA